MLAKCEDNPAILRRIIGQISSIVLMAINIAVEDITCQKIRDSEVWRMSVIPGGPANSWNSYCTSFLKEEFGNDLNSFPCRSTCGLCSSPNGN